MTEVGLDILKNYGVAGFLIFFMFIGGARYGWQITQHFIETIKTLMGSNERIAESHTIAMQGVTAAIASVMDIAKEIHFINREIKSDVEHLQTDVERIKNKVGIIR